MLQLLATPYLLAVMIIPALFVKKALLTWSILLGSVVAFLILKYFRKDEFAFERSFLIGAAGLGIEIAFFMLDNWGHLAMH